MAALSAGLLTEHASAVDIPPLLEIPSAVAEDNASLVLQRKALLAERDVLRARTIAHNGVCARGLAESDPAYPECASKLRLLTADTERHVEASKRFNAALAIALRSASTYLVMPVTVQGEVYVLTADGHKIPINEHRVLTIDTLTTLVTGANARVQFLLPDETVFTLGPDGKMVLDSFVFDPTTNKSAFIANLAKGSFRWVSAKIPSNPRLKDLKRGLKLALMAVGMRGTDFEGAVSDDGSGYIKLFSGELLITPKDGSTEFILKGGQMVRFGRDKLEPPVPIPASG